MAADRRLGKLHYAAELRHGELVPIEQHQETASRRVGQRREVIVDGWGAGAQQYISVNPDARIKRQNACLVKTRGIPVATLVKS
jgi:hypothetical protein